MARPIVVVGSINMDMVAGAPHIPEPGETIMGTSFDSFSGGKGGNQAVAAARLGAHTIMIGAVGDDAFGERLRRDLTNAGVDTSFLTTVPGPSGTALIARSQSGENSIIVIPGANAALLPKHIDEHLDLLAEAGMILVQLEIPLQTVEHLAQRAAECHTPLMLDPAPAQNIPDALVGQTSWLTPNETEQRILLGGKTEPPEEASQFLLARGATNVALKLGDRGVYLSGADCSSQMVPSFQVDAVDTTAAGDVFNAAFAVALVEEQPPSEAARFAAAASAIAVTRPGAQSSAPRREEVTAFLASGKIKAPAL